MQVRNSNFLAFIYDVLFMGRPDKKNYLISQSVVGPLPTYSLVAVVVVVYIVYEFGKFINREVKET